jgi:3-oxoacyl-[acyl-carrier-protein] synthase II
MPFASEIVITGIGVVCPIGIGKQAMWDSLCQGRSGVRRFSLYECGDLAEPFGAEVADFDPKQYVRPRKSLKVMCRDTQLAFAAADLACADAALQPQSRDSERFGVLFGADLVTCELPELVPACACSIRDGQFQMSRWGQAVTTELYPLWMLKYLPNMPACHIGIAHDARGPNNTITLGEVSSLAAVSEAAHVIARGQADVMLAGGTSSRIHPAVWTRSNVFPFARCGADPTTASRPFDARREGWVNGEGSAAFVLESRSHAEARGAKVLARILGAASRFEPQRQGAPLEGRAIRQAILAALADARLSPAEIGHVNAHGLGTRHDDRIEAQAIRQTLGSVPVTAPKSFFGTSGAACGAVEMVVSLLAFQHGLVPHTLNYEVPDPECPVNVVHSQPQPISRPIALLLNHTPHGQAMAVVIAGE